MSASQIKELQKSGKLEEAYNMAKEELDKEPDNIWCKRSISWVYYDYLKENNSQERFDAFTKILQQIVDLDLSKDEKILFESMAWQIGKMGFSLAKENPINYKLSFHFFNQIKKFPFPKPSDSYTFLFKAFHKLFKGIPQYIEMADWWDFENFQSGDYEKEIYNEKPIMPLAERAYDAYAKQFLGLQGKDFDTDEAEIFLEKLSQLIENHPDYQFPAYYKSKFLLRLGRKEEMLSTFIPFAKKKRNDFWVWEVLGKAYQEEDNKTLACYCRALICKSPEEMLISVRQELTTLLIQREWYSKAKTEIEAVLKVREHKGWKIPNQIKSWTEEDWYKSTEAQKSNQTFYRKHAKEAESLLFSDIPQESVIVEFVNSHKKILNFIASEKKFGFFKYGHFLKKVEIGDTLIVRFSHGQQGGRYQVLTVKKQENADLKEKFLKSVEGEVKIDERKSFGFIDNVYIHPNIIKKRKLKNGDTFKGHAIKSFNSKRKEWGWKVI